MGPGSAIKPMLAGVLLLAACSSSDRAQDGAPLAGSGGRIASSSAGAAAVAGNAGVGVAGTAAAGAGDPAPIVGVGGGAATGGAAGIGGVGGGAAAGGAAGAAGAAGSAGTAGSAGSAGNGDPCAGLASDCFPICEGGSCQCECPALSCLVARDFTTCCGQYRAVSETELQQDECLVRYPGLYDEVRAGCLARSPIDCAVVQCGLPQPAPSRVAVADGTGGCRFGDECEDGDDCVLAVYSAGCCDCGNSLPRALVEADACYATALEPVSFPPACPRCLSGMPCGACAPPQEPTCLVNDDAANVCR